MDRSAAYATRWVAKNVVAAGLAKKCTVEVSYVIGMPDPLSVTVDTFGTGRVDELKINRAVRDLFDLTPNGIIGSLNYLAAKGVTAHVRAAGTSSGDRP